MNCASFEMALKALQKADKTAKALEDLVKWCNYLRRKHNFLVFYTGGVVLVGGLWISRLRERVDILEKNVKYLSEKQESKGE